MSVSTTGRGLVGKVCRKARAESTPAQSDCCRRRHHVMWLECSSHILCPWVQHHAQGSNPAWPRGSEKTLLIRPARHGTSHPAHTQRLQEAEPKLLVNSLVLGAEADVCAIHVPVRSCQAVGWGDTVLYSCHSKKCIAHVHKEQGQGTARVAARLEMQNPHQHLSVLLCSVCSSFFLSSFSVKISHTAASGSGQKTCKPHNWEQSGDPGSLCFSHHPGISQISEACRKAWG